jgi:hypothetical protein
VITSLGCFNFYHLDACNENMLLLGTYSKVHVIIVHVTPTSLFFWQYYYVHACSDHVEKWMASTDTILEGDSQGIFLFKICFIPFRGSASLSKIYNLSRCLTIT